MPSPSVMPDVIQAHRPEVESALRAQIYRASNKLPLYRMIQYQLGWVDESGSDDTLLSLPRFFGGICMEAAGAGVSNRPGCAAAAIELLTASLTVHEEMQSEGQTADARPGVWWIWGPAQAINVGDGLHALARLSLFQLRDSNSPADLTLSAIALLDSAALRYYEGQYLDLAYQERVDITEGQYISMAEAKRGALMGAAAALGAHTGGRPEIQVEAFKAFGESLGVASQIRDDIALIWPESGATRASSRILNKSKLFPVAYALEHASIGQKRALGNIYFKRIMEPEDIGTLRGVLDELGIREKANERAVSLAEQAMDALAPAGLDAEALQRWESTVNTLIGR